MFNPGEEVDVLPVKNGAWVRRIYMGRMLDGSAVYTQPETPGIFYACDPAQVRPVRRDRGAWIIIWAGETGDPFHRCAFNHGRPERTAFANRSAAENWLAGQADRERMAIAHVTWVA